MQQNCAQCGGHFIRHPVKADQYYCDYCGMPAVFQQQVLDSKAAEKPSVVERGNVVPSTAPAPAVQSPRPRSRKN